MKKILIISYCFPPAGTVGVFRITKFIRYLHEFGWEPIVLTIEERFLVWPYKDNGFLNDLPDNLKIYRTAITNIVPFNAIEKKWLPNLLRETKRVYCNEGISAVLVTGPPFYASIAGFYLKNKYNIPFVFDMRDPWFLWPYTKPITLQDRFDHFLVSLIEPRIISTADAVLCASSYTAEEYVRHYLKYRNIRNKFVYLSNGFDPTDYSEIIGEKFAKYTIVYSGKINLMGARRIQNFLIAFKKLLQARNLERGNIQFIHIGSIEPDFIKEVENFGLINFFSFTGFLPYKECINKCKGADLLMIFTTGEKQESPTKMYDYTGCKRPIMAVGKEEGILAEYIKEFDSKNMKLVEDSVGDILNNLVYFYDNRNLNKPPVIYDFKLENKYYRRNLTRRLSEILNNLSK